MAIGQIAHSFVRSLACSPAHSLLLLWFLRCQTHTFQQHQQRTRGPNVFDAIKLLVQRKKESSSAQMICARAQVKWNLYISVSLLWSVSQRLHCALFFRIHHPRIAIQIWCASFTTISYWPFEKRRVYTLFTQIHIDKVDWFECCWLSSLAHSA